MSPSAVVDRVCRARGSVHVQTRTRRACRDQTRRRLPDEMKRLMADPAEIDRILGDGADRANAIAQPVLERTYDIVGLIRSRQV